MTKHACLRVNRGGGASTGGRGSPLAKFSMELRASPSIQSFSGPSNPPRFSGDAIGPTGSAAKTSTAGTFVTGARADLTIPNLDQNEADVEANIDFTGMFGARSAKFDVVQLQSGKSAVVKISALSTAAESGAGFIAGYGNDTLATITNVRVYNTCPGRSCAA